MLLIALLTPFSPRLHVRVSIANAIEMSSSATQETSKKGNLSLVYVRFVLTILNSPHFILSELIFVSTSERPRPSGLK